MERTSLYRLWLQQSLHVFAFIGYFGSGLVLLETSVKLGVETQSVWSPLGILGPPTWTPINNPTKYLIAVMTQIHCVFYILASYYLQEARYQKKIRLTPPWYVMQSYIVAYQIGLVITFRREYSTFEFNLAICGIVYNSFILASGISTLSRWLSDNLFDDDSRHEDYVPDNSQYRRVYRRHERVPPSRSRRERTRPVSGERSRRRPVRPRGHAAVDEPHRRQAARRREHDHKPYAVSSGSRQGGRHRDREPPASRPSDRVVYVRSRDRVRIDCQQDRDERGHRVRGRDQYRDRPVAERNRDYGRDPYRRQPDRRQRKRDRDRRRHRDSERAHSDTQLSESELDSDCAYDSRQYDSQLSDGDY